ncbi:isoprenylcysteine carboxylmethyltransferase family protein [Paenibacillus lentus]|uniref:methyltransferase family protein n=1 Tax=Paenibacillus lentus TaxID=1338368 RepID=UPI003657F682
MKRKNISSAVPLIFTIIGYLLGGSFAIYRFIMLESYLEKILLFILVFAYVMWSIWEVKITLTELHLESAENDKKTLELAGLIKNFMLVGALAGTSKILVTAWAAGICIIGLGLLFRVMAIKAIGPAYSHRIRELVDKPVTTGPYKIIRHPSYMGTLLIHTGLVVILFNPFSLAGLILWYANAIYRILVEEGQLIKNQYYLKYAQETKNRLIPFLW